MTDVADAPATSPSAGGAPLLETVDVVKEYQIRSGLLSKVTARVQAVTGVSIRVERGQTVGVVCESGCGKSTLGRLLLNLLTPTGGSVRLDGVDLQELKDATLRRRAQMVFQDPYASLNPRMTIGEILAEPFLVHQQIKSKVSQEAVGDLLREVGLSPEHAGRYPHEFSGGQRQRVGIARALAVEPDVIVLDEPVSALDVSIQAGVVNLLTRLQDERDLAYVFIAHDLAVVRHISDRVVVMYLGKVVETGTRDDIYLRSNHPYTRALLSAVPVPDPNIEKSRRRIVLQGDVPSPIDPPSGCRFRTRCWKAQEQCAAEEPALIDRGSGHPVACHFPEDPVPVIAI